MAANLGAAVSTSLRSREHILETLISFPDDLARAVFGGDDDEALYRPGSDGGWGVVEILPHLKDWEVIYFERARSFIEEDRPHLAGHDDELWPIERDYRGQNPREVFAEFKRLREKHVDFLRGLAPEDWERVGEHSSYGEITLHWMENHVCDHDLEHLEQARDALAR
jgi:hypothetical protein